jgi:hypothetical protein
MYIVEAQVKRAVRSMYPLGGDEGLGWRRGGAWKSWAAPTASLNGMSRSEKAKVPKVLEKA